MPKRKLLKIVAALVLSVGITLLFYQVQEIIEKDAALKKSIFDEEELLQLHVRDLEVNVADVGGDSLVDTGKVLEDDQVAPKPIDFDESKSRDQTSTLVEIKESKLYTIQEKNLIPVLRGESLQLPSGVAVHLCVVVCGERQEEANVMLKSAALVTPATVPITFHIITETGSQKYFQEQTLVLSKTKLRDLVVEFAHQKAAQYAILNVFTCMNSPSSYLDITLHAPLSPENVALEMWPQLHRQRLTYYIYNPSFPEDTSVTWKNLFGPCATQRLFIPDLLQTIDSLIYVDADTLFLRSLADVWALFSQMNQSQLAGAVSNSENGAASWYNKHAKHPYYGKEGLNSGVMLMNLTRMRHSNWTTDIQVFYAKYKQVIPWTDQDLINIYFAVHPDQMYLMPCHWNYRTDHCRYTSRCRLAEMEGVSLLHGSRRVFSHNQNREPAFAAVYKTFHNFKLGESEDEDLVRTLEGNLRSVKPSVCAMSPPHS